MARVGVLSDAAVKIHCPEMFPLTQSQYKLFHPTVLPMNKLDGVKPGLRFKDYSDFARFPDTDFRNFGNINAVNNRETAALNAIMNYRRQVGSQNLPDAVSIGATQAFEGVRSGERQQGSQPYIVQLSQIMPTGKAPAPAPTSTATGSGLTTTTAPSTSSAGTSSLIDFSMKKGTRREQQQSFKQFDVGGAGKYFTAHAKAYMGAFPDDTKNSILSRFSGDVLAVQQGGNKISVDDVHNYLLTQNPTADERRNMIGLLNQAKKSQAAQMMGNFAPGLARFFAGQTPEQVQEQMEADE